MNLDFFTPETFPSLASDSNKHYVVFGKNGNDLIGLYFAGVAPGSKVEGGTELALTLKIQGKGGVPPDMKKLGYGVFRDREGYYSASIALNFALAKGQPSASELRNLYDADPSIEATLYGALTELAKAIYGSHFKCVSPQNFHIIMDAQFEMTNFTVDPTCSAIKPTLM